MNIIFSRYGNGTMCKILNICGFSFIFAAHGEKSALFTVNLISRSFQEIVCPLPVIPMLFS